MSRTLAAALVSATFLTVPAAHAAPDVVASIKPVHALVSGVMQGVGEPTLLVEGAASPHVYSLKPSQAAALEQADLIVWIGPDMERFLERPMQTIAGQTLGVALMDVDGVMLLEQREGGAFEGHDHGDHDHAGHDHGEDDHADHDHGDDGHDHDHDHDHEQAEHDDDHHDDHDHDHAAHDDHDHDAHGHGEHTHDAHIWLDPRNATAFVAAIADALAQADPDNADTYAANAAALTERLAALETRLAADMAPFGDDGFIVFHDAYQYFENRFGLAAAGSITVNPESAPGPDRLREIRARIEELGATCVFAEPQFEPRVISVVTEGTDARSGVLDPLGADLEPGTDLYFDLLEGMAGSFQTCLSESG